jgi:opacity protein-like surface antigen
MGRLWRTAVIGAFAVVAPGTFAIAADMPEPPVYTPPPPAHFGGWYLRGYIGMTNQKLGELDNVLFDTTDELVIHTKNFESGVTFGGGIGYEFNEWFRTDFTAEYRGEVGFHGFDTWEDTVGDPRFNNYTAKKSEWLFLANAYVDMGTYYGVTPYLGAGIGASYNKIHSFRDEGIEYETPGDLDSGAPTMAYAADHGEWNLAWALHAGMSFKATKNLTIDVGYSFLNLGDAQTGDIIGFDGSNTIDNPMHFNDIISHDVKLGFRWSFDQPDYYEPAVVKY